jgi:tetratricopeptide (TPR) repeat protein
MTTPGNPFSSVNLQISCPMCNNDNWNAILEPVCPRCGFRNQPTPDDNTIGMLGEYFPIIEVKKGGMGEVFICKFADDVNLMVAFKTFQKRLFFDKVSQDAFMLEIINWMRLTGTPYIMPALDLQYFNGRPFVMVVAIEPDEGGRKTLRDHLVQGALSLDKILRYMFQIVVGMYIAQKNIPGFIHGDLKPENIFILNDNVLVSDFGLSRLIHENHLDSILESTYSYKAPECWDTTGHYSISSDVYSFGVILYEMITGKLPFNAVAREDWKNAHLNSIPSFPQDFEKQGTLFRTLQLSLNCLEKNPNDRPRGFQAILKEIEKIGYDHDIVMQFDLMTQPFGWKEYWETEKKYTTKMIIRSLLKINRIDLALKELERTPKSIYTAELWALQGNALSLHNRDEEAIKSFEKALKYENLSEEDRSTYLIQMGLSFKRLGHYDETIKLYKDLVTTVPESLLSQLIVNLATVYIASNRSKEVIALLVPFLMRDPQVAQGWGNLGIAYVHEKQFDLAIQSFRKALYLAPELVEVRLTLARVLMDNIGNIPEALASLELAYGQGYTSPELYARLGDCYLYERRFNDAKKLLEEMQYNFGDHKLTRIAASSYYRDTGNFKQALEEIDSIAADERHSSDIYFLRSTIHSLFGNTAEEIDCLKKVLEINPDDGQAATNLTISLLRLGRIEEAKKFARIAQQYGALPTGIKKELGVIGGSVETAFLDRDNEKNNMWMSLMVKRLFLYCKHCPYFKSAKKLEALSIPIQANEEVNLDEDLFRNIRAQYPESDDCPLPMMTAGIKLCSTGRFDIAGLLWKEVSKEWPSIPDFEFGLGFIFREMLQPENANKFFEMASEKGLRIDNIENLKTVKPPPCCSQIGDR